VTVWLTGLPCSGKTTIGQAVVLELMAQGLNAELLDGDAIRHDLWSELGFTKIDREENVRRMAVLAAMLSRNNVIAVVAAVSPYRFGRDLARRNSTQFLEVFVNAPLALCRSRDVKGMYAKAYLGELPHFTGVGDPYEIPLHPDIECLTDLETVQQSAAKILEAIILKTTPNKP
jgi:adenylylsulfate kinase